MYDPHHPLARAQTDKVSKAKLMKMARFWLPLVQSWYYFVYYFVISVIITAGNEAPSKEKITSM